MHATVKNTHAQLSAYAKTLGDTPADIVARYFSALAPDEYFYSPEGSLCKKTHPDSALMADGEDTCYSVGERVLFRPDEIVEWVPNQPDTH